MAETVERHPENSLCKSFNGEIPTLMCPGTSDLSLDLLKYDYDCSMQEICVSKELDESPITAWQTPLSEPVITTKKKKKKRQENAWSDRKTNQSYNDGLWTGSVEKYSYRYIPNNGCYRNAKSSLSNKPRLSFSQRKPSPSNGVVLSSDIKKFQREVTKDLRKEFQSLISTNQSYFCLNDSTTADESYEDEQDYKAKLSQVNENAAKTAAVSESEAMERSLETQSAQPTSGARLEDLLIDKRCKTTLESNSTAGRTNKNFDALKLSKDRNIDKRFFKPPQNPKLQLVNNDQVEALAQQTFNIRKTGGNPSSKSLRPIEKITPSLREMYDNSKAVNEMMRLGYPLQSIYSDNVKRGAFASLDQIQMLSDLSSKNKMVPSAHLKTIMTISNNPNISDKPNSFKSSKLGDTGSKPSAPSKQPASFEHENNTANDFHAFLPSISGKRISTKLGSLR